jgi:hypothetical protein
MQVPAAETRLSFNPDRDIKKYQGPAASLESIGTSQASDLPF